MRIAEVVRNAFSMSDLLRRIRGLRDPSPQELVRLAMECPAIAPLQRKAEFLELAELVKQHGCRHVLEIGTYRGGTLFVFSRLAESDATVISVDYHFTLLGRLCRIAQVPFFRKFVRRGQNLFLLRRNSHLPATLEEIQKILKGQKLDLLFIDADHSYAGVRADFEMYSPLVRSGGLVAFHDIVTKDPAIEVPRLWQEIKQRYRHAEFVDPAAQGAPGIGVLWA
jgi:predicted O-methyltransferase YrrM